MKWVSTEILNIDFVREEMDELGRPWPEPPVCCAATAVREVRLRRPQWKNTRTAATELARAYLALWGYQLPLPRKPGGDDVDVHALVHQNNGLKQFARCVYDAEDTSDEVVEDLAKWAAVELLVMGSVWSKHHLKAWIQKAQHGVCQVSNNTAELLRQG